MDIQIVGEECTEMHCSARHQNHNFGDPQCDFILRMDKDGDPLLESKPTTIRKPTAAERWVKWQDNQEDTLNEDPMDLDWARRGDGALMLQDEWGWFAMVTNSVGDIGAQSADGDDPEIYTVYCEPVWLSWARDKEMARDEK